MDTNAGEFVGEDRVEQWMQRIAVGETVKIKGEELEVVKIERREITLKLLSYEERIAKGTLEDVSDGFRRLACETVEDSQEILDALDNEV